MTIRNAVPEDFSAVDAFDIFAGDRKKEIESGEMLVAVVDNEVVGYLSHNKNFYGRPFAQFVCVKDVFRRRGVNTRLFSSVEDVYGNNELIFSSTEGDNKPMLSFFAKNGYKKSGVVYNIQPVPEIIFVKRLKAFHKH